VPAVLDTNILVDYVVDGEARLRKARRSGKLSRGDGVIARLRSVQPSNAMTTEKIMAMMRP